MDTKIKKNYSIWIGGIEVNDYYLTKKEAKKLFKIYQEKGYTDIIIEKIN
jgi:hypothetical protein